MSEIIKGCLGFKGEKGEHGEVGTPIPFEGTFQELQNSEENRDRFYIIMDEQDEVYYKHWVYYDEKTEQWKDGGEYLANLVINLEDLTQEEWESLKSNLTNYYKRYESIYTTTQENEINIPINISQYNTLAILEVYIEGRMLNRNEYAINGTNSITLNIPLSEIGTKVHFIVYRSVCASNEDLNELKGPKGDSGAIVFDKIADMKADTDLQAGDTCQTLGYYSANDGGAGLYKIVDDSQLVDDGGLIHDLYNGLKAELIIKDEIINVLKLGVKKDNSEDISTKLNAITENYSVFLPAGQYKVENTINLKHSIYGEGFARDNSNDNGQTILNSSVVDKTLNIVGNTEYATQNIKNIKIKIDSNITDTDVIVYNPANTQTRCYINKVAIMNFCGVGIHLNATSIGSGFVSRGVYIDTISLFARSYQNSTGITNEANVSDNRFSNIEMMFVKMGIINRGVSQIDNVHIWTGGTGQDQNNWWKGTRAIFNQNGSLHFTNLYIDTSSIALTNLNGIIMVDNFTYWIDNSISGSNEYGASIVYGNNYVDNQNVIINNARIYIGDRVKFIGGRIINLRLLYNSLANLEMRSLHDVENLQYFLKYNNTSSTTRYLPIAIFQLNGTGGRGYSEIQVTADNGQNELIKCSYDYENNFVIKGYYFNKHNYYHYKIDGNKIIIYLETNSTNMYVNVVISAKSYGMFPINMNSLQNYSTKNFIGDDFITSDATGLTRISDVVLN